MDFSDRSQRIDAAKDRFDEIDQRISGTMWRIGLPLIRYAIALVFIWFGSLKLLGISPAEELIEATLILGSPEVFVPILGGWEVAIGLCFLFRPFIRLGIFLLFLQLPGTFLPMVVLPEAVFTEFPYGLTVEGQYIVKNLVIIGAAMVIGGTVRGDVRSVNPG